MIEYLPLAVGGGIFLAILIDIIKRRFWPNPKYKGRGFMQTTGREISPWPAGAIIGFCCPDCGPEKRYLYSPDDGKCYACGKGIC